jgi:hypothetical protein
LAFCYCIGVGTAEKEAEMKKRDFQALLFEYGHHLSGCQSGPECYCGWETIKREIEKDRPELVAAEKAKQAKLEAQWKAAAEAAERRKLAALKAKYGE